MGRNNTDAKSLLPFALSVIITLFQQQSTHSAPLLLRSLDLEKFKLTNVRQVSYSTHEFSNVSTV